MRTLIQRTACSISHAVGERRRHVLRRGKRNGVLRTGLVRRGRRFGRRWGVVLESKYHPRWDSICILRCRNPPFP